ncbi:low specificity L-threonine aldolase [Mycobacterium sp. KBS0706]|uniref:threonine aldolase family protein n=1 Tax=Mycobacterium sp. KBS0706 TaxID=2578109 RepID=UPI001C8F9388|nr:low specificity L-threonine aldolase [Mycobacterium sp. KBS0706]
MSDVINLASDNVAGAAPEILAAIASAAGGRQPSYGGDEVTARLQDRLSDVFERRVAAFPVPTGTAANALALATFTPPWGAVLCHREAHVAVDECGAPEFYTHGAKLLLADGAHGKLTPATLTAAVPEWRGDVHRSQPALLSLSQATESGTVYSPAEIGALAEAAGNHGLTVHMDGSRFANALAGQNCSPAELTWKAGVDVLSFGGTKNGCVMAEAVVFFDPDKAADFAFRRKRAGHLLSKMRFVSAQLEAYLADGLWLRLAGNANARARQLAAGLQALPGVTLEHPVEANEVFVRLPAALAEGLPRQGVLAAHWEGEIWRFVGAFDTDAATIETVLERARRCLAPGAVAVAG